MKRGTACLLVCMLAFAGCQSIPWLQKSDNPLDDPLDAGAQSPSVGAPASATSESGLALSSEQRFSDVPLPVGVKDVPKESYVYETANVQVGRMVYKSRASVGEIAQFYIDQAPAGQWKFQNIVQADKGADLTFTKPGRTLTVTIKDQGVLLGRRLVLHSVPDNR
ncbi:MAG TPA: hypothetical protein PLO62_03350 [Candidatus Hydrogenedentes bacterium]|nr:hypothetical protein [Candidatus Hydrogenedentota bacterium]HOS04071.1 hypothetical protein [Candidatus Hydrogenedentota bacterium]